MRYSLVVSMYDLDGENLATRVYDFETVHDVDRAREVLDDVVHDNPRYFYSVVVLERDR